MIRNTTLTWKLGAASLAFLAAIAVYCFTRLNPPGLLESFQFTNALIGTQPGLFGSAPSLFYTLSLGLLIGACASGQTSGQLNCLVWIGLSLCLEISQASIIAEPFSNWLVNILPDSIWGLVGPYWTQGVFDQVDLLATAVGGAIALAMLTCLTTEKKDEAD